MESRKPPEVVYRRLEQAVRNVEDLDERKVAMLAQQTQEVSPGFAEDMDDDTPISSDVPEDVETVAGSPAYGQIGMSRRVRSNLEIEPVSGYPDSHIPETLQDHTSGMDELYALDAWYAEFGHPGIAALLRRPEVVQTIAEITAASDDRVQITETEAYPWRCVCALNIIAADGSRWIGTGWLAGPRTVITAGHCVYMHGRGGWVSQIEVIPGGSGDNRPYQSGIATSFRTVKGWARKQQWTCDYGAIILPEDCAFGQLLGHFGFIKLSDLDLKDLKLNIASYPGDKPSGTQWYHTRHLNAITPRTLEYPIDTAGGQSGAPVWRLKQGQRHVVGIHINGDAFGNSAIRITGPIFDNIISWQREGA